MTLLHHTESNVELGKLDDEAWDAVHYALVLQNEKGLYLIGFGDTITDCKNKAISNLIDGQLPAVKLKKILKYIAYTNLNDGISYELKKDTYQKLNIYLCEGKVYIYAGRYGICGMKLLFDSNSPQPYVRYAGYEEGMTRTRFNAQF